VRRRVLSCGLVEHRYVRLDAVLMHQPAEHLGRAIGAVAHKPSGTQIAQIRITSQHGQPEPLTNDRGFRSPNHPKAMLQRIADRSQGVRMPVSWRIASVDEDTASKQTSCTPCQALHADEKSVESVTSFHFANSARSDASLSSTSFTASDPSRRCAGGSSACASFTIAAAARLGSPS
jgi:hypothetical protein